MKMLTAVVLCCLLGLAKMDCEDGYREVVITPDNQERLTVFSGYDASDERLETLISDGTSFSQTDYVEKGEGFKESNLEAFFNCDCCDEESIKSVSFTSENAIKADVFGLFKGGSGFSYIETFEPVNDSIQYVYEFTEQVCAASIGLLTTNSQSIEITDFQLVACLKDFECDPECHETKECVDNNGQKKCVCRKNFKVNPDDQSGPCIPADCDPTCTTNKRCKLNKRGEKKCVDREQNVDEEDCSDNFVKHVFGIANRDAYSLDGSDAGPGVDPWEATHGASVISTDQDEVVFNIRLTNGESWFEKRIWVRTKFADRVQYKYYNADGFIGENIIDASTTDEAIRNDDKNKYPEMNRVVVRIFKRPDKPKMEIRNLRMANCIEEEIL